MKFNMLAEFTEMEDKNNRILDKVLDTKVLDKEIDEMDEVSRRIKALEDI